MPTQVLALERDSQTPVWLRPDAKEIFVAVLDNGRPVALLRLDRPASGYVSGATLTAPDLKAAGDAPPRRAGGGAPTPISIVIPTHERPDDLARCLQSLAGVERDGHEVIVVDNGPVSRATAAVSARFGVRAATEERPGANRARNAGAALAHHDIVAFVDDDVVVAPDWATAVGEAFADPTIGCVTGLVLPLELETTAQEMFERYCRHRRGLIPRTYMKDTLAPSAAGVVGMGANMAFRRQLLKAVGGFDERFGPGMATRTGDDTELFARVLDAGATIAYRPDVYVWHRHRRTIPEVRSCVFGYGVGLFSVLTKRVVESRDLGALITGVRWWIGPPLKSLADRLAGRLAPPWLVVLAETAGAPLGPFCYAYESMRRRSTAGRAVGAGR